MASRLLTTVLTVLASSSLCAAAAAPKAIDLASRRELFVDRHLIDRLDHAALRLHRPRREGIAVKFDKPWEGEFSAYITVLKRGPAWRMYYRGSSKAERGQVTCVAESADGIAWTRPTLDLVDVGGSRANNVILAEEPFTHNFSPLLDDRPGVEASRRYKAIGGSHKSGLVAFVSADGLRWRKMSDRPILKVKAFAFDSHNLAFWSAAEKRYVCYFRTWKRVGSTNYRWISRATSKDFVRWSEPVEMTFADSPPEHYYTNGTQPYFRAPHVYVALAKRFFPRRAALPPDEAARLVADPQYRVASSDSILMTSRGGSRYDRTFLASFIRPGPSARDWISRDNTPALGLVQATDRRMFLYRLSHYAQPTSHVARYSLRLDGFVSVHAPIRRAVPTAPGGGPPAEFGGQIITKPLTFTGRQLEINFSTGVSGGIRVEIQDAAGRPVPGFALADCPRFIGDRIEHVVAWRGGNDVSKLAGRPVRLRFELIDADLYSLRFR
jgi:hypothetical protein